MEDRSLTIEETLQSIDDTLKRIEDFLHNGRSISVSYGSGICQKGKVTSPVMIPPIHCEPDSNTD